MRSIRKRVARLATGVALAASIALSGGSAMAQEKKVRANMAGGFPSSMGILGPAQAPLAVLRGRHRRRFLVKADRNVNLQRRLADWIARTRVPDRVKVQLDIDPYSFL